MLRDQGVSYQAYISQISYLLFLKERVTQIGEASMLPDGARWSDIKDGADVPYPKATEARKPDTPGRARSKP